MTGYRTAAPLAAVILAFAAGGAGAQQGYDPMAAARGSPALPGVGALVTPPARSPAAAGDPELGFLPAGPGAEDTYYQCIGCHSTAIIRQQRLTDERWNYVWNWMIEQQGMLEPDPETSETILTYLKTHFSSER